MPSGTGRGIALGIEQGARNFLDSFLAVKQAKHEEKYRKLAPIIQLIHSQIQDPNTSLDQKRKAINLLPGILGVKSDVPLDVTLGLDKLAEQEVDTGEEQVTQGQEGGLVEDQNAVDFNQMQGSSSASVQDGELSTNSTLATSVQTKSTKTLKKPLIKRRGELSANDINLMKQIKLQSAEDESHFQRQYRLALVQAELQERVLDKNGWKNNGDWAYDETTKTWQQEWFNPITKESYQQKLPSGVTPETVILKQIQASGGDKGGLTKAYKTFKHTIAQGMGLEDDDPRVDKQASAVWSENVVATVDWKKQGVTGDRKPQPAQIADDKRADEQNRIALQGQLDFARSKAVESSNKASITANEANAFYNNNIKPLEAREQSDDLDDDEKRLLSSNRNEYQRLKSVAAAADAEDKGNKVAFQAAQERVSSHGTSASSTTSANVSPRMQVRIDIFRKKNPTANLTDEQIASLLKAQGYKD